MASRVDIANLALTLVESNEKIASLTDNNVPARALNAVYDLVRKAELRKRYWSFAISRAALPALATPPTWGFAYAYNLPADFLRLMQVGEFLVAPAFSDYVTGENSPYAIETKDGANIIATDFGAPLQIRYVRDVVDEGTFDPTFVMSFAGALAMVVCGQITGSNTKKTAAAEYYKTAIREAVSCNAIEKPPASIADDSWMIARL